MGNDAGRAHRAHTGDDHQSNAREREIYNRLLAKQRAGVTESSTRSRAFRVKRDRDAPRHKTISFRERAHRPLFRRGGGDTGKSDRINGDFPPSAARGRLASCKSLAQHAETHAFARTRTRTAAHVPRSGVKKRCTVGGAEANRELGEVRSVRIKENTHRSRGAGTSVEGRIFPLTRVQSFTHPVSGFLESLPLRVWSVSVERHPGLRAPGDLLFFKAGHSVLRRHVRVYTARLSVPCRRSRARAGEGERKEKIIGRTRRERDENRQTRESGLRETGSRCCWRGTSLPLTK